MIHIILAFSNINTVYSAGDDLGFYGGCCSGHGHPNKKAIKTWTKIEALADKNIIKIRTCMDHSFFLEANRTVWCCGRNDKG